MAKFRMSVYLRDDLILTVNLDRSRTGDSQSKIVSAMIEFATADDQSKLVSMETANCATCGNPGNLETRIFYKYMHRKVFDCGVCGERYLCLPSA